MACVSNQMSRYFHHSVSPPCPLRFCPDALQKKEYRDSPREPTLVMPRANFSSDALYSLRWFLISFFLNWVARCSGSENSRRKPSGISVKGLSSEGPRPGGDFDGQRQCGACSEFSVVSGSQSPTPRNVRKRFRRCHGQSVVNIAIAISADFSGCGV